MLHACSYCPRNVLTEPIKSLCCHLALDSAVLLVVGDFCCFADNRMKLIVDRKWPSRRFCLTCRSETGGQIVSQRTHNARLSSKPLACGLTEACTYMYVSSHHGLHGSPVIFPGQTIKYLSSPHLELQSGMHMRVHFFIRHLQDWSYCFESLQNRSQIVGHMLPQRSLTLEMASSIWTV